MLDLDTNFRIFFEIFRSFQKIWKFKGGGMWIFRAIVTKRYLTRAEREFITFCFAVFTTFSFLTISEAYVLFTSQRYYIFSRLSVLIYFASIVHTYILYAFFKHSRRNFTIFSWQKAKAKSVLKTIENIDISEKCRKSSRNLVQILEKFGNFDENFQKEI